MTIGSLREYLEHVEKLLVSITTKVDLKEVSWADQAEKLLPRTRIELRREYDTLERSRSRPTTKDRTPKVKATALATAWAKAEVRRRHQGEFFDIFYDVLDVWMEENNASRPPMSGSREYRNLYKACETTLGQKYPIERGMAYEIYLENWRASNAVSDTEPTPE